MNIDISDKMGNEKMPSIVKDPFNKKSVKNIYVFYQKDLFSDNWAASGSVEFRNGNTDGKQSFKGESFDDVVLQIKRFLEEIK